MLVSVVCPAFNCEKYLSKTLDSILNQTVRDLEVLVVDDGSTDSTVKIARDYAEKDNRVKVFHNQANQGAAYSRNLAIANATGEFVAFLDGDDLWLPTKLEEQIAFMKNNRCDFSYTAYETINESGKQIGRLRTGPKKVTHRGFLHYNYIGCLTVMYRRSICPDLSIPDNIDRRNDYALWLKLSERCDCYFLNKTLSFYRIHGDSLSSGNEFALLKKNTLMFKKLYSCNTLIAWFCGLRNAFFWFYKRIRYESRPNNEK